VDESERSLRRFVECAMALGASDRFIADLLKANGWTEKEIYSAFREYYEESTGHTLPVRRQSGESAREAFLYLVAFSTLFTWAYALGSLLFALAEYAFPDAVRLAERPAVSTALEIASLVVAFPVFIVVSRMLRWNRTSPVRKWMTYLALAIAAGVLIGDAVTVVAYLLQGGITTQFLAKAAAVAMIAGGIFYYYLREVSAPDAARKRVFGYASSAVVAVAIIVGMLVSGSPAEQRARQADRERTRDLAAIGQSLARPDAVTAPSNVDEFRAHVGRTARLNDPFTGQPYEYIPGEGSGYQLCAVFETDSRAERSRVPFWAHPAGRHCFLFDSRRGPPSWPR
jgi:hypothetical protein